MFVVTASALLLLAAPDSSCAPYEHDGPACVTCTEELVADPTLGPARLAGAVDERDCGGGCYLRHCVRRDVLLKVFRVDFAAPFAREGLAALVSRLRFGAPMLGCTAEQADALELVAARYENSSQQMRLAAVTALGQLHANLPAHPRCAEALIDWYRAADAPVRPILAMQLLKLRATASALPERRREQLRAMPEIAAWVEAQFLREPATLQQAWDSEQHQLLRLLPESSLTTLEQAVVATHGAPFADPATQERFLALPWYELHWDGAMKPELTEAERANLAAISSERKSR